MQLFYTCEKKALENKCEVIHLKTLDLLPVAFLKTELVHKYFLLILATMIEQLFCRSRLCSSSKSINYRSMRSKKYRSIHRKVFPYFCHYAYLNYCFKDLHLRFLLGSGCVSIALIWLT